ncbi:MAG: molybdate ABC transporter substrate-binding protein [Desulfomonilaceae bacterium]
MARFLITLVMIVNLFVSTALANMTIAAGAGYKRMVGEIIQAYENKTGHKVDPIYGDMKQIMDQAKTTGVVALVLGEHDFLKASDIDFASFCKLGKGILVIAFGKKVKLYKPEDLADNEISKVAMADPNKTIYGSAAKEFLQNSGLYEQVDKKLVPIATCPKILSSVLGGEIQAGFVNLTEAIYLKDRLGGYIVVDQAKYKPINLVIGVLRGFESRPKTMRFLNFIQSDPEVKNIINKSGL